MESKEELRQKYIDIRSRFKDEQVLVSSDKIRDRFFSLDIVDFKQNFLLYHSFRKEIVTYDIISYLLKIDKNVYLPYISENKKELQIGQIYNKDDLELGAFGIKEPKTRSNIPVTMMDVIVVPGLIYAVDGFRLGYGGGYYDRLLVRAKDNTVTIGLVYDCLLHDKLPIDNFDIPVKIIITEKQTLFIGGGED